MLWKNLAIALIFGTLTSLGWAQKSSFEFGIGGVLVGRPGKSADWGISVDSRINLGDLISLSTVVDAGLEPSGSSSSATSGYDFSLRLLLTPNPLYLGPMVGVGTSGFIYGGVVGLKAGLLYVEAQGFLSNTNPLVFSYRAGVIFPTNSFISPFSILPTQSGSSSSSTGTISPGGSWNITSTNGDIYISVWDNECEDGDKISIETDGFYRSVELTNRVQTFKVHLTEGSHSLTIVALNGTGYKGNCSFKNENTYSIRVWGEGESANASSYEYSTEALSGYRHTINLTIP